MRSKRTALYTGSSPYGIYKIIDTMYDGRPARLLYGDRNSPQSRVACGKHFELSEMEAGYITPWVEGGHATAANCQMLCREDNRRKGKG